MEQVEAKPNQVQATNVVISEFRFHGDGGGNDEFVELYNPTSNPVNISGWWVRRSSNSGSTFDIVQIPSNPTTTNFLPGQYYLVSNTGYSGSTTADLTYSTTGIADDGGVALTLSNKTTIIDQVGLSNGSAYREGTAQSALTSDIDQGYERKLGGAFDSCQDDTNNISDFQPINPSKPQNSSTPRRLCGVNADLRLAISASNLSPAVGENVTFTINVVNYGASNATNVSVKDYLPSGMTFVSANGSGTYDNGLKIWTVGTLASGASASMNIIASFDDGITPKTYQAEVWSSDQIDPDSIPKNLPTTEDDDYAVILGVSTLNITNVVNDSNPNIGANIVFTITVSNLTAATANNVAVDASLPPGLEFISASAGYSSSTGIWTIGTLSPGSASLTITTRVMSSTSMLFVAEVSSVGFTNNYSTATVTPIPSTQANLKLEQSWVRSSSSSDTAVITLKVTNQDAANIATNVQVRDLLPTGLTYVSHTSGKNYSSSSGIWAVGTVNANSSVSLDITVKVSASGTSTTNFAEIWLSDQFDPNSTPGNGDVGEDDSSNSEVLVSDLSLTQTSNIAGPNAVFTIKVTNSGPDDATNIQVSNTKLHTSYGYVSHSVSAGTSYDKVTGVWTVNSLVSGATATLIVTTTVISPDENWAEVSAVTEIDPDSLPNNGSRTEDDDAASPSADLSLTQSIISPVPYVNSDINTTVTFRITVSNAGYANATGIEVKDLLPSGLTYVSHTSGQTYSSSNGIWSVGSLLSGQSASLDLTAKVTTYGIRTNWAEVWKSGQSDPDSNPGDGSTIDDDDASAIITSYRSIIFNEIAWAGTTASDEDEWIELYNPSDSEITITGWQIKKNSCLGTVYITLSGKVSKDGYFLLERGDTSTDNTTVSDVSASQIYLASATPALSDSGETLYLCDNFGNFIDTANNEGLGNSSNPWPAGNNSSNRPSMERLTNSTEVDSSWGTNNGTTKNGLNANGGAIYGTPGKKNSTGNTSSSTSPTATPAPTSTPIPPTLAIDPRPILNEILARPGFDWNQDGKADVFDEFIEIKNLTAIDISLSGWKLDKVVPAGEPAKSFTLPAVTLKPGERIVFYGKQTNILLSDGGETVRLISPGGKIYDAFTYELARAEDRSFCRLPDGNPGNSWFEDCIPTPNLTNTREGKSPASPDGSQSPVCNLPDTLPLDFFIPECNGYGANIWNPYYWDKLSWAFRKWITDETSKWDSYIE